MKATLVFTNIVGSQPPSVEVKDVFVDFNKEIAEVRGISKDEAYKVYKKMWPDDKRKMSVRQYYHSSSIDLIVPTSIVEFFKAGK